MKKRVLIVGSGKRVQDNFLPIFDILSDKFEVTGIVSRTYENARQLADKWGCDAPSDLAKVDWPSIDLVVVSISPNAVPDVLDQIASYRKNLAVVADTPALLAGQIAKAKVYSSFRSVLIAEDFMNFPQFELMRRWAFLNGPIDRVEINHAGYDYHATALARSFFGFPLVESMSRSMSKTRPSQFQLHLADGNQAIIKMPYQRSVGTVCIYSGGSCLTWGPNAEDAAAIEQHAVVNPIFEGGILSGFQAGEVCMDLPYLQPLLECELLEDKSLFNLLKTCGLIRVLEAIDKPNINSNYGAPQGIYDAALSRLFRRSSLVQQPALSVMPMLVQRAVPRTIRTSQSELRSQLQKLA